MHIPSPQELGLPEDIQQWRPGQEEFIEACIRDKHRTTAICAPTGFGKTPATIGYILMSGKPTALITESRSNQDQIVSKYACVGAVDLRGKTNYQCQMREDYSCAEGELARCPFVGTVGCPLSKAEIKASTSRLVVMNYDKWTYGQKWGRGLQHITQVIFDEGHTAESAISRSMQVLLGSREVGELLGIDLLKYPASMDMGNWKHWALDNKKDCDDETATAKARLREPNVKQAWIKKYHHLQSLSKRLGVLATCRPLRWVVDESEHGYQFDPISVGPYTEGTLLLGIPRIIFESATMRRKVMYRIGQKKDSFSYHDFPSDFDRSRCPFYWMPTMRVDHRAHDLSPLWHRMDQFGGARRDRNGIIHPISHSRVEDVLANSRLASHMISHQKGVTPAEALRQFRETYPGAILLSPSVSTGHDFPLSQAEWQFICKVPFPPPSLLLEARKNEDEEYPYFIAAQALDQMLGRPMRQKKDQVENMIADDHIKWFMRKHGHLLSRAARNNFIEIDRMPIPPPRLERAV